MPYRNFRCRFSAGEGGKPRFRLSWNGFSATGWIPARLMTPVRICGNVALLCGGRGRHAEIVLTRGCHVERPTVAGQEWMLLTYAAPLCCIACPDGAGNLILAAAGSLAAALSLDPAVAVALPHSVLEPLEKAMREARVGLAEHLIGLDSDRKASPAAEATVGFLSSPGYSCIYGRGEERSDGIWSFSGRGGKSFAVAGVARGVETVTVGFPFLPHGRRYKAEWIDDGLEYYVKGDLEIRPEAISSQTKAVVKMAPSGGFLVRLSEEA